MQYAPVVVSLPIADRQTSYRFYQDALGLEAVGEPAEDGIPEPLQFVVNEGLRIMLVPTGGFGWVIGEAQMAARGQSECVLSLPAATPEEATRLVERARAAGAEVVVEPGQRPWAFTGVFADPDGHLWMAIADVT
ncbi:hypothetical protein GA0070606_2764 [Micromonospora citrea]|uniref:VOC domain-containing protein n=1 Tax=Micromonospora citrea TaxID=47855 RepID=A0A1C6UTR7_9ACTN|nr:VOC family protein [Micromonospora citrea]SCL57391.1 hypothetical protein GA0070606_2764 [Micromonospora citrea]